MAARVSVGGTADVGGQFSFPSFSAFGDGDSPSIYAVLIFAGLVAVILLIARSLR